MKILEFGDLKYREKRCSHDSFNITSSVHQYPRTTTPLTKIATEVPSLLRPARLLNPLCQSELYKPTQHDELRKYVDRIPYR